MLPNIQPTEDFVSPLDKFVDVKNTKFKNGRIFPTYGIFIVKQRLDKVSNVCVF